MIMANEKINSSTETTFKISNIVCEGCAEKITTTLKALPGVKEVKSKAFKKQIQVNYYPEQIKQEELKNALEKEGYIADEV